VDPRQDKGGGRSWDAPTETHLASTDQEPGRPDMSGAVRYDTHIRISSETAFHGHWSSQGGHPCIACSHDDFSIRHVFLRVWPAAHVKISHDKPLLDSPSGRCVSTTGAACGLTSSRTRPPHD